MGVTEVDVDRRNLLEADENILASIRISAPGHINNTCNLRAKSCLKTEDMAAWCCSSCVGAVRNWGTCPPRPVNCILHIVP